MASRKFTRRIIGWAGLILLFLASVVGIAYYHAAGKDFYFKEIKELARNKAGYVLTKSEPLSFSLFPSPALTVENLRISNPALDEHALIADVAKMSATVPWSDLLRFRLDLQAELTAPKFSLAIDVDGTRNWMTPELLEIAGGLPFELVRIDSRETELFFRNHQTSEILGLDIHQLDIDLRDGGGNARIETAGRLGKSRFFVLGDVTQQGGENRFAVHLDFGAGRARETRIDAIRAPSVSWWIRQNAVLFPLQGDVSGELELKRQLPAGELMFEFATANLDEFYHFSADLLTIKSDIGPLRASGRAVLTGSDVDIRDLDAQIEQPEISLEVKGNISNLLSVVETGLTMSARTGDLNAIVDTAELIPVVGERLARHPMETGLDVKIKTRGESIALEDARTTVRQGSLSASLSGRMSLTDGDLDFNAELLAEAPDSSDLARILDVEEPEHAKPGPMRISAGVSGTGDRLSIAKAGAEFHGGRYRAAVNGIVDFSGDLPDLDLSGRLDIVDAAGLRQYLEGLPDPLLDELAVSVQSRIEGPVNDFSLGNIELKMVRADRDLIMDGEASGLPGNPSVDARFHFSLQEPLELEKYFPQLGPQRLVGPMDMSGIVAYADRRLVIDDLALEAEQTDLGGLITIDFAKEPPRIYVIMDSRRFETRLVTVDEEAESDPDSDAVGDGQSKADEADPAQAPAPQQDPGEAFREFTNAIAINTEWINDLDLYLSFTAEQARLGDYDIESLDVILDARDRVFTVANYEITLGGRPISLQGHIDANSNPPSYLFKGSIENESLEALFNLEDQMLEGGQLSGEFVFLSEGNTLGEVIRHLDGNALFQMGPLTIRSKALDYVASDILHSMLGGITRSEKERRSTNYQCGVLGINVQRGIALIDKSFTLQARDYNLSGKGKIDLNTGYVELAARPRAKKGLGLSLSSLVGGFRVEGHIATPKFGLGGGGLITAAVVGYALTPTMAAAAANPATATIVATGFFAKGIFDRLTASSYSCEKTLDRIERNRDRRDNPRSPHTGKMGF